MGCELCPRNCKADRKAGKKGRCSVAGPGIRISRAALHMWEEPCISGKEGSGTVFFTGCPLGCVYCQNAVISGGESGKEISPERLKEIFLELQEKGANNINLVTPTHYSDYLPEAVTAARKAGLRIPIVYNCGGYEKIETLKMLEGIVDIYLTDFKYGRRETAQKYSNAPDYPEIAFAALKEMHRQQPEPEFDERGMMKKGIIVRHLLLPEHVKEGKEVLSLLYEGFGDSIYISIMNQYTPLPGVGERFPELGRGVTKREYERLLVHAYSLGITNAFIQEGNVAKESFIPPFDLEGV